MGKLQLFFRNCQKTQLNALCYDNTPVTELPELTQFSVYSMYMNMFKGKFKMSLYY